MSATPLTDAYLESRCIGKQTQSWVEFAQSLELAVSILRWCVEHNGECLGDHPDLLQSARDVITRITKETP